MEIDPHCHHQKDSLLSVDFSDAKVAHEFAQLIVHSSVKLQLGVRKQLFFCIFAHCNAITYESVQNTTKVIIIQCFLL